MAKKKQREHSIAKNKRAYFEYAIEDTYEAGIVLTGAEIKSVRDKKVSIGEAYCYFDMEGIFKIKGMRISEFKNAGYVGQNPDREKLLLLTKNELKKIQNKLKDQGMTINGVKKLLDSSQSNELDEISNKSISALNLRNKISNISKK